MKPSDSTQEPPREFAAMTGSPVSCLEHRNGRDYLRFQPHGYEFPILLPVITRGSRDAANAWTWNGSLENPTLKPSVKTTHADGKVSHIWLTVGMCHHLGDSTDGLAGQTLPLVHLANDPSSATAPATRVERKGES